MTPEETLKASRVATVDKIEKPLYDPDYETVLHKLADFYRIDGEILLSNGYRWLAEHGKKPIDGDEPGDPPQWEFGTKDDVADPYRLPKSAQVFRGNASGIVYRREKAGELPSNGLLPHIYRVGAQTIGMWLAHAKFMQEPVTLESLVPCVKELLEAMRWNGRGTSNGRESDAFRVLRDVISKLDPEWGKKLD